MKNTFIRTETDVYFYVLINTTYNTIVKRFDELPHQPFLWHYLQAKTHEKDTKVLEIYLQKNRHLRSMAVVVGKTAQKVFGTYLAGGTYNS